MAKQKRKKTIHATPEARYIHNRTKTADWTAQKRGAWGKIPPKDMLLKMELQGYKCMYCKVPITLFGCHIDHVYAITLGGEHYLFNIAITCVTCNLVKHDHSLRHFCKKMDIDYRALQQEIADLNQQIHNLTDYDDEYKVDGPARRIEW